MGGDQHFLAVGSGRRCGSANWIGPFQTPSQAADEAGAPVWVEVCFGFVEQDQAVGVAKPGTAIFCQLGQRQPKPGTAIFCQLGQPYRRLDGRDFVLQRIKLTRGQRAQAPAAPKITGALASPGSGQLSGVSDALHPALAGGLGTGDQGFHAADNAPIAAADAFDLTGPVPKPGTEARDRSQGQPFSAKYVSRIDV